jgi:hypothetical protein
MNSQCPDPSDFERYQGSRVVLTTGSELAFCGTARELLVVDSCSGLLLETDAKHGLCIWCPLDHIKRVRVIPVLDKCAGADDPSMNTPIC